MFTGLVEATGRVQGVERSGDEARLRVETSFAPDLDRGESVAIDGVCLTIVRPTGPWFEAMVYPETLAVTGVGGSAAGRPVNLEVDMVGRYVVEYLKGRQPAGRPHPEVTREHLVRHGFMREDQAP